MGCNGISNQLIIIYIYIYNNVSIYYIRFGLQSDRNWIWDSSNLIWYFGCIWNWGVPHDMPIQGNYDEQWIFRVPVQTRPCGHACRPTKMLERSRTCTFNSKMWKATNYQLASGEVGNHGNLIHWKTLILGKSWKSRRTTPLHVAHEALTQRGPGSFSCASTQLWSWAEVLGWIAGSKPCPVVGVILTKSWVWPRILSLFMFIHVYYILFYMYDKCFLRLYRPPATSQTTISPLGQLSRPVLVKPGSFLGCITWVQTSRVFPVARSVLLGMITWPWPAATPARVKSRVSIPKSVTENWRLS